MSNKKVNGTFLLISQYSSEHLKGWLGPPFSDKNLEYVAFHREISISWIIYQHQCTMG